MIKRQGKDVRILRCQAEVRRGKQSKDMIDQSPSLALSRNEEFSITAATPLLHHTSKTSILYKKVLCNWRDNFIWQL